MLLALKKQIFLGTAEIIFNTFRYLDLIYANNFLNFKTKKAEKHFI